MAVCILPSRGRRHVSGSGSSGCEDIGRWSVCRRNGQGGGEDDCCRHACMLPSIGELGGHGRAGVGWPARWVMRRQPAWIERGRSSKLFVGNAYTVRKYLIINLY
jgi:hypothetical protein